MHAIPTRRWLLKSILAAALVSGCVEIRVNSSSLESSSNTHRTPPAAQKRVSLDIPDEVVKNLYMVLIEAKDVALIKKGITRGWCVIGTEGVAQELGTSRQSVVNRSVAALVRLGVEMMPDGYWSR